MSVGFCAAFFCSLASVELLTDIVQPGHGFDATHASVMLALESSLLYRVDWHSKGFTVCHDPALCHDLNANQYYVMGSRWRSNFESAVSQCRRSFVYLRWIIYIPSVTYCAH